MATWISHMRIADYFMKHYPELNNIQFLVGNIGPDCGVPNEDWSVFTPSTQITHWNKGELKSEIDVEGFKKAYLQNKDEKYPFYLGYYFHLLTDIEWSKFISIKKNEPLYAEGMEIDKVKFIWTAKKDWYGLDHVFLQEHGDFVFFTHFSKINEFPNLYLDYYSNDAFIRQIKYITEFYFNGIKEEDPNREFIYMSKDEMNNFVESTIDIIKTMGGDLIC